MPKFNNKLYECETHDFIDGTLVGVEIEGETGVAEEKQHKTVQQAFLDFDVLTDYFSIKLREALLVVFVRMRP